MSVDRPGLQLRPATPADAPGMLAIYAPIVETTAISFELVPPSETEFAERIAAASRSHAWLTAERAGRVAGYAYGTMHRARAAYRYAVEVSVYVHADERGAGTGTGLYEALFESLTALGYFQAYAGITLPNAASIGLHRRVGFRHVGTFPSVGFKFGEWHDVSWWHRPLNPGKPETTDIDRSGAARR